jgi:hypothetical protein
MYKKEKSNVLIFVFLKDMKSGPPLYSPMDQTGSYPPQAVLYPSWTPMPPQQVPVQAQQAPPHPMYGQAAQLRQTLAGFNHHIPSYMQSSHENGGAFVVPLPVQQLQQLQIANGHPGAYCVVNPSHPALFMSTAQQQSQQQHDQ